MQEPTSNYSTLVNKRIVILGGSSGIGLATAKAAVKAGAQVVIVSGNQQRLNTALSQLPATATNLVADLSSEDNIKALFHRIGNFDHLAYTAGENIELGKLSDTDISKARQFFNLRYWGAVAAVKYAAPYINAGGSIVLTGGSAGSRPQSGWGIAASICCAMEGFTRAMAVELAPIRVNITVPGFVRTPLWDSIPEADREALFDTAGSALPVKHIGHPDEIAQTYLYLMQQTFSTGQSVVVDGGGVLV